MPGGQEIQHQPLRLLHSPLGGLRTLGLTQSERKIPAGCCLVLALLPPGVAENTGLLWPLASAVPPPASVLHSLGDGLLVQASRGYSS